MPISEEERLRRRVAYRRSLLAEAAITFHAPLSVGREGGEPVPPEVPLRVGRDPLVLSGCLPTHPLEPGSQARIRLSRGVEALIFLDGHLVAGLDRHHGDWPLPALAGQAIRIIYDHGPTRSGRVVVEGWDVVAEDLDTIRLADDLEALLSTAAAADPAMRVHLLRAADAAVSAMDRVSGAEALRQAASELGRDLWKRLEPYTTHRLGAVFAAAYSHLDAAWFWTFAETRTKFRRTMANALQYLEAFPEAIFHVTQAWCLERLEEDDPDLFSRVRDLVRAGRIRIEGGMWVESDVHLASGETILRQLLLGQGYFADRFHTLSRVGWLPDSFGFPASLPQIFWEGGLRTFVTPKLNLNETNVLPHNLFRWTGIDGTELTTVHYRNPLHNYDGQVEAVEVAETYQVFRDARVHPEAFLTFGHGDGGGGPTLAMGERLRRLARLGGIPAVRQGAVEDYLAGIEARRDALAEWRGELYFELTRGTYSSQARLKSVKVDAEASLIAAEMASSAAALAVGRAYPGEALRRLWREHALYHFHDVLAGTVPGLVYEDVRAGWERVKEEADRLFAGAMGEFRGPLLCATGSSPLPAVLRLPAGHPWVEAFPGSVQPDGEAAWFGPVRLPAGGATARPEVLADRAVTVRTAPEGMRLENAWIRVMVGGDGEIRSLSARGQEEMLSAPTRLALYPDRPMRSDAAMQAWDVDVEDLAEELAGAETVSVRVLAEGPLVARIAVRQRVGRSEIARVYHLDAASPYVRVEWEVDWQERERWLKWWIPVAVNADRATTGIPMGADTRPTHGSTPWDAAKFEVYAHEFVDLSEGDRGLAVFNRDRYGHAFRNGAVGVTLLRSPGSPDPHADQGRHGFVLGLYPHDHGYTESDVAAWAEAFSRPARLAAGGGSAEFGGEWFSWSGEVGAVSAIKASEDEAGYVVRLVERTNRRGRGTLRLPSAVRRVVRTNALEGLDPDDRPRELALAGRAVEVELKPFEIVTLVAYTG